MPRMSKAQAAARGAISALREFHATLSMKRDDLSQQITAIEQAIAGISGQPVSSGAAAPPAGARGGRRGRRGRRGGGGGGGGGKRPPEGTLKAYIERVLRKAEKPMQVKAITAGVRAAGYPTKNKTLEKSVGIAVTQIPGIKKVKRGTFTLK